MTDAPGNYGLIRSVDELEQYMAVLQRDDSSIGFDIETGYEGMDREHGSLMPHAGAFVVGFSFTNNPKWARYVPLAHELGPNLPADEVWDCVRPVFEQKRIVAHNAKFEKRNLRNVRIELGIRCCTLIEAYCLSLWQHIGLKDLVETIFKHQMTKFEDLFPDQNVNYARFNRTDLTPQVVSYACEDAAQCLRLHNANHEKVLRDREFVYNLEMQIMEILCDMEDYGVAMDWEAMQVAGEAMDPFLAKYEAQVKAELGELAGMNLSATNLNSPPQLRTLLFGGLGLKAGRKTKTGLESTDEVALTKLAKQLPALDHLLRFREIQNLRKRFAAWLDEKPKKPRTQGTDGRVHANYAQTVVGTGRFSANDPAIQQCPKEWKWVAADGTECSGNFRNFLVASPGRYILGFDYSQVELRVLAGLSNERALWDAFENDEDVHTLTAAFILGKRREDVDPKLDRPQGKTMNFALVYGLSVTGMADRLGVSTEEAQKLFDAYFAAYPSITSWHERTTSEARRTKCTISWIGRRNTIWDLVEADRDQNRKLFAKGLRVAGNSPVQGGAADYMKIAMVRVRDFLVEKGWWNSKVHLIMNQHDALYFEVDEDIAPTEMVRLLRPRVEFPVKKFPKVVADFEFSYRWGSPVPIDEDSSLVFDSGWRLADGEVPAAREHDDDDFESEELAEVIELEVEPLPEPKHRVIVEVPEMPSVTDWARFVDYVRSNPGDWRLVVRTPDGEVETGFGTSITPENQAQVYLVLPGSVVYHPAEDIGEDVLVL